MPVTFCVVNSSLGGIWRDSKGGYSPLASKESGHGSVVVVLGFRV